MSKVRIGALVVSVVLFSAFDPGRTYSQMNPADTTLSSLTFLSDAVLAELAPVDLCKTRRAGRRRRSCIIASID